MGAACCKQANINTILRRSDTGSTELDDTTLGKDKEMTINPGKLYL